jgi:hypothetical protein
MANGVSNINLNASAAAAQQDFSEQDKKIQEGGDIGQGEGLTDAKRRRK